MGTKFTRFTASELEYFFRMELSGAEWTMKKAAVALMRAGRATTADLFTLDVGDVMPAEEG